MSVYPRQQHNHRLALKNESRLDPKENVMNLFNNNGDVDDGEGRDETFSGMDPRGER